MKRALRSGLVLLGAALLGGAVASCELLELPDGYLDESGDGSAGPSPGADGSADTGTGEAGAPGHGGDGGDGGDATTTNPGDASSSDGSSAPPDGGSEAGSDAGCASAALSLYAVNGSSEIFTADLDAKRFVKSKDDPMLCDSFDIDTSHLTITRAGQGIFLTGGGALYQADLSTGNCGKVGDVTGGSDYGHMDITYARPASSDVDRLYTYSPAGLGVIDAAFAWSKIGSASGVAQSLGSRIKPAPQGMLAVLTSDDSGDAPEFASYILDPTTGVTLASAPLPGATDNGDGVELDFALFNSTFYLYAGGSENDDDVYTFVAGSDATFDFDFGGEAFVAAAQSTCVQ